MAAPQIVWFRQDLRLDDQAALRAAAEAGPVIAAYVLDEESEGVRPAGGAARWWLHHSLAALSTALEKRGGSLWLARGRADRVLACLAEEVEAAGIHALRHTEPWWPAIERRVPRLTLHEGMTLAPPGAICTKSGGRYRVFTPYWRAHRDWGPPPGPRTAPRNLAFAKAPQGERLDEWGLLPRAPDWAAGFSQWEPGEEGARSRLTAFLARIADYEARRNLPADEGTSRLSPHLHHGEISPARCWHEAAAAVGEGKAEPWLRQLVWRDFAHETLDQFAESATRPHRDAFEQLAWTDLRTKAGRDGLRAWQRGRTGYPLVDAGMRQLWATGFMHNRVRMVVASFLVKHLLIDWRRGEEWFWDTLVDADLANNAMGWQWVTGSGVDSAPFHRMFNPVSQGRKFEAGDYIRAWVPELAHRDEAGIHGPFPGGCGDYPPPIVDHGAARARALKAYRALRT